MKRILYRMMVLAACALVGAGCGYDDSELTRNIDAIDKELSALEKAAAEMNAGLNELNALIGSSFISYKAKTAAEM